jgi:MOSC domain-containing protein YiiM
VTTMALTNSGSTIATHRTLADLEACLDYVRQSPRDMGRLELLVSRPAIDSREVLDEGRLDIVHGFVGDNWSMRGSSSKPDRSSDPNKQVTIMNARVITALAGAKDRWPLAGDQLFVDFDLSASNIPPGTRIQMGSAVLEVTAPPHRGCQKFTARFGRDATAFVNSTAGIELNLRGINARVVQDGVIRVGDSVRKLA